MTPERTAADASSPVPGAPPWRIGVDVGGTFTDVVVIDRDARIGAYKSPSRPDDPASGVVVALELAAAAVGVRLSGLLSKCALLVHGSTVATNTILEHTGAVVGLLATDGFRDSLEIRRGIRRNPWDHRTPYPPVLVPRYLRLPVGAAGSTGWAASIRRWTRSRCAGRSPPWPRRMSRASRSAF